MGQFYLILVFLNSFCLDVNYEKLKQAPNQLDSLLIAKEIIACYDKPDDWTNAYTTTKTLLQQFSSSTNKVSILNAIINNSIYNYDTLSKQIAIDKINLLINRAYYNNVISKYYSAKIDYEEAFEIFDDKELTNADYPIANYGLRNLANIYTRLGDNKKAQTTFEIVLVMLKDTKVEADIYASICIDLGIAYANGANYENAIGVYKNVLKQQGISMLYRAKLNKMLIDVAFDQQLDNQLENAESLQSQIPNIELENIFVEIIEIFKGRIVEDSTDAYNWLSGTYKLYGDVALNYNLLSKQEIIVLQKKSLDALKKLKSENPNAREIAKQHYTIGQTYLNFNETDSAKLQFYLGLKTILPKFNPKQNPLPDTSLFFYENAIFENLEGLAEVFTQQDSLGLALRAYELAFYVKLNLRSLYDFESSKLYLQQKAKEINCQAIEVAWQLYKKTKDEQYVQRAFKMAESSRALVLLEGIMENQLRQQSEQQDSTYLAQQKDRFDKPIILKELQKSLTENETLIEYFQADSFLYVFKIEKNAAPNFYQFQLDDQTIETFLNTIRSDEVSAKVYAINAHKLYKNIFAPLKIEPQQNIIIIPDGQLNYLPFEALVSKSADINSFKKQQYLLENHSISYQYSATIFDLQKKQNQQNEFNKVLAIAPVFDGTANALAFSDDEVNEIKAIFPTEAIMRKNCQKDSILKKINKYKVLHFSTHASADSETNQQTFIALHNDSLKLEELYQQKINADLTVLSACETNIGKYQGGEGVMSLSRAFAYAGCPSLVSTLWQVNEKSTKDIIVEFYKNLKKGNTKDEALLKAKLHYLKNTDDANPYYWASLVSIGSTKRLVKKWQFANWQMFLLALPLSLVIIFFLRNRKNHSTVK